MEIIDDKCFLDKQIDITQCLFRNCYYNLLFIFIIIDLDKIISIYAILSPFLYVIYMISLIKGCLKNRITFSSCIGGEMKHKIFSNI